MTIGLEPLSPATVEVSRHSPHVAVITMVNPPLNVLTSETRRALAGALGELDADVDVRGLVLTGAGSAFCAGMDLRQEGEMAPAEHATLLEDVRSTLVAIESFRAPVVAAINGPCIGGGLELALACDIRLASTDATFSAAGVNVGLIASVDSLPRLIGESRAKAMLLTGQRTDAATAEQWGLLAAVHDQARVLPAAFELAEHIATRPPLSVEATKAFVRQARGLDDASARRLLRHRLRELLETQDHKEAVSAFLEKRVGEFKRK